MVSSVCSRSARSAISARVSWRPGTVLIGPMKGQHWWKSPVPKHGLCQMSLIPLLAGPTMRAAPLPNALVVP